jgi:DNA-binding beta-propeller fold protein YncE
MHSHFRLILAAVIAALIVAAVGLLPAQAVPAFPDVRRTIRYAGLLGGHGDFVFPYKIARDAVNNLYVSDLNANKVFMYDQNGQYLREFGTGAETTNSGDLPNPMGVVASGNTLYVVDQTRNVVQFFNLTTTAPTGFFALPSGAHYGMALGPDGKLYIANFYGAKIEIFTTAGASAGSFGVSGTGDGQLDKPIDVAFDSLGYLYVLDFLTPRVQKFNRNGVFIRKIGYGNLTFPENLTIDRANHIWVTNRAANSVQVYDVRGNLIGVYDGGPSRYGGIATPAGIAVFERPGTLPAIYIADLVTNTVQRFQPTTIPLAHTSQQIVGTFGSGPGQFRDTRFIAQDSAQNLYVADSVNRNISVFDKYGAFLRNIGSGGSTKDKFSSPFGVAVSANGEIYVTDGIANAIYVFGANGTFLRRVSRQGTIQGLVSAPAGIALGDQGALVVVDRGNNRFQKFNLSGGFLQLVGGLGSGNAQFNSPTGVAVDPLRELIYVADQNNNRVQVFDILGNFLAILPNTGDCSLTIPYGLTLDGRGSLYVANYGQNRIVKYTQNGACLSSFGSFGLGSGQFYYPVGVAYNPNMGALWVSENVNARLQRFGAPNVRADRIGVYRPSSKTFFLRNTNSAGAPDFSFALSWAAAGDIPVIGDWNGDGVDTVGFYRPSTRQFLLNNLNASTTAPLHTITFGLTGDIPLIGDWDGDGIDGIGVFRPSNATFYLRNIASPGNPDLIVKFGAGTDKPIVGDWDADGRDSVGVWRPSNGTFYLNNGLQTTGTAPIDRSFVYGLSTDFPITGDWTEQGLTSVGVWRPNNRNFLLRNTLTAGAPNAIFTFGLAGDIPVTGEWGNTFTEAIPPADTAPIFNPRE